MLPEPGASLPAGALGQRGAGHSLLHPVSTASTGIFQVCPTRVPLMTNSGQTPEQHSLPPTFLSKAPDSLLKQERGVESDDLSLNPHFLSGNEYMNMFPLRSRHEVLHTKAAISLPGS